MAPGYGSDGGPEGDCATLGLRHGSDGLGGQTAGSVYGILGWHHWIRVEERPYLVPA